MKVVTVHRNAGVRMVAHRVVASPRPQLVHVAFIRKVVLALQLKYARPPTPSFEVGEVVDTLRAVGVLQHGNNWERVGARHPIMA